ncbi:Glucose inhibited division protein A [Caminicella sporogenes DSM 14501]|uniref:Glucose inhibited division protein A n=1 Tax=Caminicella sporogenes DSM 14501 TaxID=1121266 RepID=A0A1M6L3Z0_9FIRM|nr:FAD-dependent oxidoreductase [Caminicella sporogenes]RKD27695.1 FAD-dependent oxidoreductase [Caminicella sporogenes]SHJ65883.1 Glucose inhibited division protein A [Caminicella sporogenes DSM 14501]
MTKVIIIGGGWAGCAAAVTAKKAGADVLLLERTDMLLGLGNVGGIMRNNGRYTAAEEAILLGAGDLFKLTDKASRHVNIDFPGHKHASLYDVCKMEPMVRRYLIEMGIEIKFKTRVVDVQMKDNTINGIVLANNDIIYGDVFIETTGSTGPMGNCLKYGNGCAMCILRCPTFGPRVSISMKAGIEDILGKRSDGSYGAFSGSCKLNKDSLSEEIVRELNEKGVVILPLPKEDINLDKLKVKVCQQYALKEFAENIILLDTGHAKLMAPFYPLEKLRKIKGLENARFEDPYSGGIGNSIRYLSIAPRENSMKVKGIDNLFCAGEKSGLFVGHTEAIVTGSLAGHNSVRHEKGLKLLELPVNIAIGDLISFANKKIKEEDGLKNRFTFAGSVYFDRMKELNLYSTDREFLKKKIKRLNLINIFEEKIV